MRFSNNSINTYLKCKAAYYWYKVRGVTLRKKSGHLLFGSLVSDGCECLVNCLKDGMEAEDAIDAGVREVQQKWVEMIGYKEPNSPKYKSMEAAISIITQVAGLLTSGTIPGEIVGAEVEYTKELAGHEYIARIDLLMKEDRGLVVYDYKTMTSFYKPQYIEVLRMDRQLKGYVWAVEEAVAAYHIPCVVDSRSGKVKVHDPVEHEGCHEEELELWYKETAGIVYDIDDVVYLYGNGGGMFATTPGAWPREATACFAYGRPCDYLPLCSPNPRHAGRIDLADPDGERYIINNGNEEE